MLSNNNTIVTRFGHSDEHFKLDDECKNTNDRYIVTENRLPQIIKSEYHNIADIYFLTHSETLGIEALESSMAGCFIICKKGFLKKDLIKDIDHFSYENIDEVDFDFIKSLINPNRQRENVKIYSWEKLNDRIYELFNNAINTATNN
jgi:hypothetical protein